MKAKLYTNQNATEYLFYLLLCLASLNIYENGALCLLCACLLGLYKNRFRIPRDGAFAILVLFAIDVIIVTFAYSWPFTDAIKAINYPLIYMIGKNSFEGVRDKESFIKKSLFSLFLGFLLQIGLDYVYNLNMSFSVVRKYYSVWTGELVTVTLIGLLCAGIIGYSFYGIFISHKKWIKFICIIGVVLTVVINLFTATRTPIVLLFLTYVFMFSIWLFSYRSKNMIKVLGIIIGIVIASYLFIRFDVLGIKTYIQSSSLFERILESKLETERTDLFQDFFVGMFKYPFGGRIMSSIVGKLPHNFIQEAADAYGIVAFICLIGFFIQFIYYYIRLIVSRNKKDYHFLIISFGFAMLVQSCMEPIISGYPMIIWSLIFIAGIIKDDYVSTKRKVQ